MHYLCFYLLDLGWTMKEVSGTEYYAVLELPNVRESHTICDREPVALGA